MWRVLVWSRGRRSWPSFLYTWDHQPAICNVFAHQFHHFSIFLYSIYIYYLRKVNKSPFIFPAVKTTEQNKKHFWKEYASKTKRPTTQTANGEMRTAGRCVVNDGFEDDGGKEKEKIRISWYRFRKETERYQLDIFIYPAIENLTSSSLVLAIHTMRAMRSCTVKTDKHTTAEGGKREICIYRSYIYTRIRKKKRNALLEFRIKTTDCRSSAASVEGCVARKALLTSMTQSRCVYIYRLYIMHMAAGTSIVWPQRSRSFHPFLILSFLSNYTLFTVFLHILLFSSQQSKARMEKIVLGKKKGLREKKAPHQVCG